MPEIEITEDQYQYLEALREDIQTDVVGKYAHVRTVDALQYLIDSYEGDVNATVPESGDEAGGDGDKPGGFVVTDGSTTEPVSVDEPADGGAASGDESTESVPDDAEASAPMAAGGGGDDGMLSAMMQLLQTYDEKWAAVEGDTGYEVELPDGSTETANTRDDVRALLFKHYE